MIFKGLVLLSILQLLPYSFIMANSIKTFDSRGQRLFAGNLFSFITDKKSSQNVIYSPASIHSCLALTYLGAKGQTAAEISNVLHLEEEDKPAFATKYGNFLKTTFNKNDDDTKPQLKMSTRLYVNDNIGILPEFNRLAKNSFGSEAKSEDFSRPVKVVEKINKWVEEQTQNKIKDMLQNDAVNADTTSVLINTIYFKAKWLNRFSSFLTSKTVFRTSLTNQIEVDTMNTEDTFGYAELNDINAKVLQMPYENSDISMWIILPNNIDGLKDLENALKGKDLNEISGKLVQRKVDVFLPKFRIESDIDLKETLEKMGCSSMFAANADLSGMFDSATQQRISDVKHKAILECDEDGTEAAAATFMKISPMSFSFDLKVFRVDHPFVFVIRSENVIYFAGHVAKF